MSVKFLETYFILLYSFEFLEKLIIENLQLSKLTLCSALIASIPANSLS